MILLFLFALANGISVSAPYPIVNGRSVRIDVSGSGPGTRLHVDRIVACSGVDMPFVAYDAAEPGTSGCNSSGYMAHDIYSEAIAKSPSGSLASTFRVRIQNAAIFLRRRLISRHAPVVRLQLHLSTFAGKRLVEQTVTTVQYSVDELALPLNTPERIVSAASKDGGEGDKKNVFGVPINDGGRDDDLQFVQIMEPGSGTRTPWYMQTLGMFGILVFGLGVALVIWLRVTAKYAKKNGNNAGDYQQNRYQAVASFMNRATRLGFFSSASSSTSSSQEKTAV